MTTNADRLRQVMLRHRADGYLRFDLPSGLCTGPPAATLRTALDGVYRVSFYPNTVQWHSTMLSSKGFGCGGWR
jgi:hypothetical protein